MRPRDMDPSRLASPASWASLRSPGANSRPLSSQHPSHSDSSLAPGSSDGSLQAAPDEGLGFGVCPPRHLDIPVPVLRPVPAVALRHKEQPAADRGQPPLSGRSSATRRKQRSHSSGSGGSRGPSCPQKDCVDPSDEEGSMGRDGCHQALCSEHLSETLNSLSLTSLLAPGPLAPTAMKKCNSTGSIDRSNLSARGKDGRHTCAVDPHGFSSSPWIEGRAEAPLEDSNAAKSSAWHVNTCARKKR
ncbi:PREDICTED: voltage-dependent T-type calcium channel subunit alpha-1I-like [Poecilia mexicana]|uniref:voltage-dependent T-type calcium channel subunit alpha-1I-like n=1 Tax=Poecilia mexicana TaxID=48701 RepID=UPI00072EE7D9|nr:PREDICTED: voltage-dependent T-type calcium channel subunit alpha-1I-like [Poecilia mexicana]